MKFLELARKRYSLRKYSDRPVDPEAIKRCVEAARLAPSACNAQPWKYIVIDNKELKNQVAELTKTTVLGMNKWSDQAPVIVAVVSEDQNLRGKFGTLVKNKAYKLIDLGISADHFCLQATEEGIGTCMIGWFNEKKIKKLLKVPRSKKIELIITMGYPDKERDLKKVRKEMSEIYSENQY